MKFYIQLNTDRGTKYANIEVDSVDDLKNAVGNHFVENYTWMILKSWQVVCSLGGGYNSYPAELKTPQELKITAKSEIYSKYINPQTKMLDLINTIPAQYHEKTTGR